MNRKVNASELDINTKEKKYDGIKYFEQNQ